ncbi:limonene-1,2-epoxide hydrolase [Mycolicibacterium duvalii]|uniref:Limonene-1,2-epoxide hydrolase n=1 Tax=Mycolicibacterium duvalii TaxID=39688 RepID=A0A7I7K1T1_9MYCO|nr:limonene-1,2-epoxide hydrolase family protein [Mycolicibacterium duvalii]MCV7367328.1 nuclear transport factor 2 family protein [Mycolicibacterium duvalii]PEG43517.1 limonene-1,2-epoxide hydrolase [Mycolicibacterium duvalii]BBX17302.1 limonene-1,2-epoxide hydrolase [Mycolicibacterium duvalii]
MTDQASHPPAPAPSAASVAVSDNADIVQSFLFALADSDLDTFESLAAPDLLWQNVGLPSLRGRVRIMKLLRRSEGRMGFAVKFHSIAAEGETVLTERTDAIVFGPLRLQFWVCGRFEVHDGQITLWRDYFDLVDCLVKAPLRALAATVFPSLRPTF